MKLTVVGCSGSFPGPDSAASCYLVEARDPEARDPEARDPEARDPEARDPDGRTWRILLDLGSGALGPLQRYTSPYDVDAVLLSHLHPDHCLDLTGLYVALKYRPGGPAPAVTVYGPTGTAVRLARAYDGLPDAGMSPELDVHTWTDEMPVAIGPFTVTPYAMNHPIEAYGLRVEADGAVLAYTGDTDSTPNLTPLCRDADLVLADSAFVDGRDESRGVHLTARRAGRAATEAGGVRRLVLTHMPPWNDPDVARRDAAETWSGLLDVARPGATFELGQQPA